MWALLVVALDKSVEARLLLQDVRGGRLGGFGLERQVHALMPAVLFRMAGADALDLNPEPQPPDRQTTQAVQRVRRRKRHSVVRTNRCRQTEFGKHTLKDR